MEKEKYAWFFDHMTGMFTSYIAAVSAFSAVNLNFLPMIVQWLWPTFVGVPILIIWATYYKKKFYKGIHPADVATVKINMQTEEVLVG